MCVCVCLQSTQWPLSGLHSALKLSGSVFTAWSTGRYQGLGRENGSPHGRIEWKNIVDELCFHEEPRGGKVRQVKPVQPRLQKIWDAVENVDKNRTHLFENELRLLTTVSQSVPEPNW